VGTRRLQNEETKGSLKMSKALLPTREIPQWYREDERKVWKKRKYQTGLVKRGVSSLGRGREKRPILGLYRRVWFRKKKLGKRKGSNGVQCKNIVHQKGLREFKRERLKGRKNQMKRKNSKTKTVKVRAGEKKGKRYRPKDEKMKGTWSVLVTCPQLPEIRVGEREESPTRGAGTRLTKGQKEKKIIKCYTL